MFRSLPFLNSCGCKAVSLSKEAVLKFQGHLFFVQSFLFNLKSISNDFRLFFTFIVLTFMLDAGWPMSPLYLLGYCHFQIDSHPVSLPASSAALSSLWANSLCQLSTFMKCRVHLSLVDKGGNKLCCLWCEPNNKCALTND